MRRLFTKKSTSRFGVSGNDFVLRLIRVREVLVMIVCLLIALAFVAAFVVGIATGSTLIPLGSWALVSYEKQPNQFILLMCINGTITTALGVAFYAYGRAIAKTFRGRKDAL